MKRISALLALVILASCYDPNKPPPCHPGTIDYPRCIDPTLPAKKNQTQTPPQFGASLLYPGGTVYPVSIYGSTALGRSILTAPSASAVLALLGVQNIDTWENAAIAHANSVVSFRSGHHTWFGSAVAKLGTGDARWTTLLTGTAAVTIVQSGEEGGCNQITTGVNAASSAEGISVVNGLGSYGASYVSDLANATAKWHVAWDFKFTTTPDAQAEFAVGWASPAGAPEVGVGIRGAQSTGFYRLFRQMTATGQTGATAIDNKRHRTMFWHDGSVAAGTVNWMIDGVVQTPLAGYNPASPGAPYWRIANGTTAAAQTVILCQFGYQGDGVAIPPP